ncbi:MAG: flagellin lysine-N-methylase, partial [Lachnospiraceae bacterium]|nr:flagellin lysine-N-methylase [Lachnospiraceae bacterium]
MQIRYPEYYKKFRCLAGECPDTCCAGWEIPVDRESEKRYRSAYHKNRRFGRKLRKYIKNGQIVSESWVCPFLDGEKLCEIYKELGPDALCKTCRRHPRHREDYGNLHEILLLLSCPEAARLVLEENSGDFYVRDLPERMGNTDGIDGELLDLLLEAREEIWA